MLILPEKSLIILLPWKTASQSLRARLNRFNSSRYPNYYYYNPALRRVFHQHITLPDFLTLPEAHQGYRLATFVRNPYDRVVSGFLQAQRDIKEQPHYRFPPPKWIRALVVDQLIENQAFIARCQHDLNTWITHLPDYLVHEIGRNTSLFLHPCHYWTHLQGRQHVDFIGKVETFEEDFQRLCAEFDLSVDALVNVNVSTEVSPAFDAHSYRYCHLLTPEAIARIEALFAEDFTIFGYPRIGAQATATTPPASAKAPMP